MYICRMNSLHLITGASAMFAVGVAGAATLSIDDDWTQSGGSAEWGSNWSTAPTQVTPSFLPTEIGGTTSGQVIGNFDRDFGDNTVGIDVKNEVYYIQFIAQIGEPSQGQDGRMKLLFIDGANPTTAAAVVGFSSSINNNLNFFATTTGGSRVDLLQENGDVLVANFNTTYAFDIVVDPIQGVFSTMVSQLDVSGVVVTTATSPSLPSADSNIFNNGGNGILRFENTTQNTQLTRIDEITVSDSPIAAVAVPEPSTGMILGCAAMGILLRRRRPKA